jgi:hypothetical protein
LSCSSVVTTTEEDTGKNNNNSNNNRCFLVCNPLTRSWRRIPDPPSGIRNKYDVNALVFNEEEEASASSPLEKSFKNLFGKLW